MAKILAMRTSPHNSVCKDCPNRAVGCHTGCEAAAAEEILKTLRRAASRPKWRAAQDLGAIKTNDIIRRLRRERRR